MSVFRRKTVTGIHAAAASQPLARALGAMNLTAIGVGAIIGTGIFVFTGQVAARNAGPAVMLSLLLAGLVSACAALCYAELATVLPVSGSAYTYSHAAFGEVVAWIVGWGLILEFMLGAVTVASAWSGYVVSVLRDLGIHFPCRLSAASGALVACVDGTSAKALFNLPAVVIIALMTALLVRGIKASSIANEIMVVIKVVAILVFIVIAGRAISPANWHPFVPPAIPGDAGAFGFGGVLTGTGIVFLAYIGFDTVSAAAEEAKNPERDLPIGILVSLFISAVLYVAVAAVITGVVPYPKLDAPDPIGIVARAAGLEWMARVMKLAAVMGLSSVILILLLGQARTLLAMARDGLVPELFGRVHPRFRTPHAASLVSGAVAALVAGFVSFDDIGRLVTLATLAVFVMVSLAAMRLRYREPNVRRAFRAPALWLIGPASVLSSLYLMKSLAAGTWHLLAAWLGVGMVVYAAYGYWNARRESS